MGRKVHPVGFRIGIVKDWQTKWHAEKHFVEYLQEDLKLRQAIATKYVDAGISQVEIERQANKVTVTIHTARPGIVIGRGGQRVDEVRRYMDELVGKKIQLNIREVARPELDALLVARSVAEQISRRIAYRRAMKQAMFRTMQAGAQGIKISCSGRLGGVEIARRQVMHQGRVPLHTLRADIDYGYTRAHTSLGDIGVKVWIYRGDILPEAGGEEVIEEAIVKPAEEAEAGEPSKESAAEKEAEVKEEVKVEAKKEPTKPRKKKVTEKKEELVAKKPEAVEPEETKAEEKKAKPKKKAKAKVETKKKPKPEKKQETKQKMKKKTKDESIEKAAKLIMKAAKKEETKKETIKTAKKEVKKAEPKQKKETKAKAGKDKKKVKRKEKDATT
jgi:small subunit ribosomal protein S3